MSLNAARTAPRRAYDVLLSEQDDDASVVRISLDELAVVRSEDVGIEEALGYARSHGLWLARTVRSRGLVLACHPRPRSELVKLARVLRGGARPYFFRVGLLTRSAAWTEERGVEDAVLVQCAGPSQSGVFVKGMHRTHVLVPEARADQATIDGVTVETWELEPSSPVDAITAANVLRTGSNVIAAQPRYFYFV